MFLMQMSPIKSLDFVLVSFSCFVTSTPHKFFFSVPGQMFLMDRFFDGTFLTFGIEVISFAERDQEDRIDPMVRY
jgi:hypothetical protein